MGREKFRGSSSGPLGRGPDICQHLTQHRSIEGLHQPFSTSEWWFARLVQIFSNSFGITLIIFRPKRLSPFCRGTMAQQNTTVFRRSELAPAWLSEPHPSYFLHPLRPATGHPVSRPRSCALEFHREPGRPGLHAPQAPVHRAPAK